MNSSINGRGWEVPKSTAGDEEGVEGGGGKNALLVLFSLLMKNLKYVTGILNFLPFPYMGFSAFPIVSKFASA